MQTLIAHTNNKKKLTALKAVFEAMEIEYEIEDSEDETERILKNPVNTKHLNESIKQVEEGKLTAIKIEDLWK
jgi:nickel-dependent lactate racemase